MTFVVQCEFRERGGGGGGEQGGTNARLPCGKGTCHEMIHP